MDGHRKQCDFLGWLNTQIEENSEKFGKNELAGMKVLRRILTKQGAFNNQFGYLNVNYTKWNHDLYNYQMNEFWSQNGSYLIGYNVASEKENIRGILSCC